MSFNPNSPEPIQPLSLGNVVSAGLRLYRSHLKSYLRLSFIAYAWVFVPIYGWAKCLTTLALISRLAFGELVNQPESIQDARRVVDSRMWQFFVMGLLMFVIWIVLLIVLPIIFSLAIGIITLLIMYATTGSFSRTPTNPTHLMLIGLLTIMIMGVFLIVLLWFQSRFLIVDIPLAIEVNVNGSSTIGRSWNLTKGNVWKIAGIIIVGYLVIFPVQLPFNLLSSSIQNIIINVKESQLYLYLVSLIMFLMILAIFTPFWQSIKAVIYYDLRSRREGFGLKLRDREV